MVNECRPRSRYDSAGVPQTSPKWPYAWSPLRRCLQRYRCRRLHKTGWSNLPGPFQSSVTAFCGTTSASDSGYFELFFTCGLLLSMVEHCQSRLFKSRPASLSFPFSGGNTIGAEFRQADVLEKEIQACRLTAAERKPISAIQRRAALMTVDGHTKRRILRNL